MLYLVQLMKAEEKGCGGVAWSVYGTYIKAAGGPVIFIINILFFLSTTGSIAFSNWWLSYWIRQGSGVSCECAAAAALCTRLGSQKKSTLCAPVTCNRQLHINLNVHD